jgi:hypothetical protein
MGTPSFIRIIGGQALATDVDDLTGRPTLKVAGSAAGAVNWGDLGGTLSDQADLQAALDAKAGSAAIAAAVSAHEALVDPHPQYLTASEGDAAYEALGAVATALAAHTGAADPHPGYLTAAEGNAAYQALDATLTALAGLDSSAGLVEQTGTDTFTKRAIGVGASTSVPTRADGDARWQTLDAELTALAGLTSAADRLPYFTGSGAASLATFTSFARTLLDDADATTMRSTLGLVIGTNVQAQDAELAALAGLTSAADALPYFTGSGTASTTTLSSFARTLIDDADATAMRATLGLVIGTNVQAQDAELAAIAGLTSAADSVPYFTGSGTAALMTVTAAARTVLDDTTVGAMLTTLGGQPLDNELTALAGLTSAADRLPYFTGSGTASLATFTAYARTLLDDADAATARGTLGLSGTGVGLVPAGGTSGQVLKKNSGTDYDYSWAADATGGGGGLSDADYGDITVSGTGTIMTIDAGVVTLAKMANLAANSIIGNHTGSPATPLALTAAQVRTLINVADGATAGATWGSNITSQPSVVSQAEAEAGSATTERIWTAQRVNQAIQALAPGGGGGLSHPQILARSLGA